MDLNSLKYAKSHEWVAFEGKTATVGITDFAVHQLTDLGPHRAAERAGPSGGRNLRRSRKRQSGERPCTLPRPAKSSPSTTRLADDLGVLSDDPFGKGWMIKLKLTDPSSLAGLMDRAAYEAHCADEEEHA